MPHKKSQTNRETQLDRCLPHNFRKKNDEEDRETHRELPQKTGRSSPDIIKTKTPTLNHFDCANPFLLGGSV